MCTCTYSNYTNSRWISKVDVTKVVNWFPCGYCADCIRRKKSEWRLRAYYEALETFNKSNSFVLFDTLTYRDSNLKWFHDIYKPALYNPWDFMAFSRSDIDAFFKRLRSKLERGFILRIPFKMRVGKQRKLKKKYFKRCLSPAFPDSVNNLRYLITSEYGTSEGCTHRPHYHILFFVNFKIDPLLFSRLVSLCWVHGRTDGVPYKSRQYVRYQRLLTNQNSDVHKLVNYVTKYITKDLYTYRKLFKRVFMSFTISRPGWFNTYEGRLAFRRFKSQVLPFHLQSLGFGLSALDYEDSDYIDNYQAIRMPLGDKGVVASIPLPQYYQRKLYYSQEWFNGKFRWVPNDKLISIRKKRFDSKVVQLRNRLFSWRNDLGIEKATEIARYNLLWRGCLIPRYMIDLSDDDMLGEVLKKPSLKSRWLSHDLLQHWVSKDDFPNGNFLLDGFLSELCSSQITGRVFEFDSFLKNNPYGLVYTNGLPRFHGFDAILDDFWLYNYSVGIVKDLEQLRADKQTSHYKDIGFVCS